MNACFGACISANRVCFCWWACWMPNPKKLDIYTFRFSSLLRSASWENFGADKFILHHYIKFRKPVSTIFVLHHIHSLSPITSIPIHFSKSVLDAFFQYSIPLFPTLPCSAKVIHSFSIFMNLDIFLPFIYLFIYNKILDWLSLSNVDFKDFLTLEL